MKVSYEWLKEILEKDLNPEELLKIFPSLGMGVESVEKKDGDYVYDLEITPNRPDLLGMIGIVREISAYLGLRKEFEFPDIIYNDEADLNIEIEDKNDCPRYGAIVIDNIKVMDSPDWMKERIEKSGIRSLNNVVDISNYVMLLTGHPVHIFDAEKIDKIVIRRGRKNEKIVTLDGVERDVEDILLICNSSEPIAIAGIMGGEYSGVNTKTKRVIVESAFFNPVLIRRGSKKLNLKTEASYRFERTADIGIIPDVLKITGKLLQDFSSGKVISKIIDVYLQERKEKFIIFDEKKINKILGTDYSKEEMKMKLELLGFKIEGEKIIVPSSRRDVEIIEDIAEEIGVLTGYDNIKRRFSFIFSGVAKDEFEFVREFKYLLKGLGLNEVITLSFMEKNFEKRDLDFHYIKNPMWPEKNVMRTNLLYGLLNCAKTNLNRGYETISLFEIGNVFLPEQELHLGILLSGNLKRRWFEQERRFNFYDVKGVFENLIENLNLECEFKETINPLFHTEQGLDIYINGENIGTLGLINQNIIEEDAFGIELKLLKILQEKGRKFKKINRFPFLKRDISLLVPDGLENSHIIDIILKEGRFIEKVELIDIYKGKNIPEGFKSMTYRIIFRKDDGTMNSEEADEITKKIVHRLKDFNIRLREM